MHKHILAALAVLTLAAPAVAGQETRYYDASGRYQGRASTNTANPRQRSIYDASGRYQGRAMTGSDGTTRLYDQHGRYLGRTTGGQAVPMPPGQREGE